MIQVKRKEDLNYMMYFNTIIKYKIKLLHFSTK